MDALLHRPRPTPDPAHVDSWVFDMDNTLYSPRANLFAQIDRKMEAFVGRLLGLGQEEARAVQKRYFHEHGTTLRGLMLSHGVEPRAFLDEVHAIDLAVLAPDARLRVALLALPGRRLVFTNGDLAYATRVLAALDLRDCFEAVHDIEAMGWHPKPDRRAYETLIDRFGLDPARTLFAEDMAHNLMPAKALGMTTLWLDNGSERGSHGAHPDFIDHATGDLAAFLEGVVR